MIVQLSRLPKSVYDQIPYTIRLHKDEYEISELPDEVQYLLYNYFKTAPPDLKYDNVVDIKSDISTYNDFKTLDLKQAVINYFYNYILTSVGSYPFDATFGTNIKKYLQSKDTSITETLLSNEVNKIASVLSNDYNIPILINNIQVKKMNTSSAAYSELSYILNIQLSINSESVSVEYKI
jgi:hypothetical protein